MFLVFVLFFARGFICVQNSSSGLEPGDQQISFKYCGVREGETEGEGGRF